MPKSIPYKTNRKTNKSVLQKELFEYLNSMHLDGLKANTPVFAYVNIKVSIRPYCLHTGANPIGLCQLHQNTLGSEQTGQHAVDNI